MNTLKQLISAVFAAFLLSHLTKAQTTWDYLSCLATIGWIIAVVEYKYKPYVDIIKKYETIRLMNRINEP